MSYPLKWTLSGHTVWIMQNDKNIMIENGTYVFKGAVLCAWPAVFQNTITSNASTSNWSDIFREWFERYVQEYGVLCSRVRNNVNYLDIHAQISRRSYELTGVKINHRYGHGTIVLDKNATVVSVEESGSELTFAAEMGCYYHDMCQPLQLLLRQYPDKPDSVVHLIAKYIQLPPEQRPAILEQWNMMFPLDVWEWPLSRLMDAQEEVPLHGV